VIAIRPQNAQTPGLGEGAHHMHQRDMKSVGTYPLPYLLSVSYRRHRNHYCTIVSVHDIRHGGTKETIVHYMN